MISFPRFPTVELPMFDLPFTMPSFDLPTFDLPKIDLPTVELPSVDQLTSYARDAAYVGVGLAVLTAERLQALQVQLTELLRDQLAGAVAKVRATS